MDFWSSVLGRVRSEPAVVGSLLGGLASYITTGVLTDQWVGSVLGFVFFALSGVWVRRSVSPAR